jgi:class 3 adenylate cyclase/tetratricopeptide (TPR) repeat protein
MQCPACQHENEPGAKFCEECAAPLPRACANCGRPLSARARFCPGCAYPTGSTEAGPAVETYTPRHLAEKILTSRAALEGERKQVTALFADLKGSMELFADRDPEEARKFLDPVIERMMAAVHRFEGTVNHVLGDGIVALFGAPLAHEDHAVRACYAALRMQETVKRYAESVRRSEGIPIQIRVGLNSGEVVVRSIGSDLRMDYTVVGQSTNVAARMEQSAMAGSILVSATTMKLAEGYFEARPLGPMKVKGLELPIEVFELTGASSARSRLHAAAARGLTRFVGREAEMQQLEHALERARSGHGQVVAVVGEPGVGKSRLYWEFMRSHLARGWLALESGSASYAKATAFLPVIGLLRVYFQIEPGDDLRKVREKCTGKLLALDRGLEPALSALLWLLDVTVEDAQWQRLDPSQRRQRALEGVKRLLLRESQVQPLMILFEDLHWIDALTQSLLDALVESLPAARLLLLVNYRPEYQHAWGGKTYYRQMRIDPLPPESAEELLQTLLGDDAALHDLKGLLVARTDGNPFFLEETVRTLAETGNLAGERGAYRLTRTLDKLQIPATAQAILAARVDRLSPNDKRLLQAASVVGKDVPFALLQGIVGESEEALRRSLASLQAREFLYEARLFPDLEYTFKHALTREVTYNGLLHDRRRGLHGQIVRTIERLHPDRLFEHAERLAHHSFRGELWESAVSYSRQAGAKAIARSANREALAYFEQALTALTHVAQTRDAHEQAIDVRLDLRHVKQVLGELGEGIEHLREAEALALALDDKRRLGLVSAAMGWSLWMVGRSNEALALGRTAQAIAETVGDLKLTVAANYVLGAAALTSGDYPGAASFHRRIIASLPGELGHERLLPTGYPAAISRGWIAWALAERGAFDEGIAIGEEGLRLAEMLDHPFTRIWTYFGLANLHLLRGNFDDAARLIERALAVAREWQLTIWFRYLDWGLGRAYTLSRRVTEGLSLLEQGVRAHAAGKTGNWESLLLAHLSEALFLAGRRDEARATGERAVALARERGERGYEACALHILGRIVGDCGKPDAAAAAALYHQALTLAEELANRPLAAHCHLDLSRLLWRTGEGGEAQQQLNTATMMYREMEMRIWLQEAQTQRNLWFGPDKPAPDPAPA